MFEMHPISILFTTHIFQRSVSDQSIYMTEGTVKKNITKTDYPWNAFGSWHS